MYVIIRGYFSTHRQTKEESVSWQENMADIPVNFEDKKERIRISRQEVSQ